MNAVLGVLLRFKKKREERDWRRTKAAFPFFSLCPISLKKQTIDKWHGSADGWLSHIPSSHISPSPHHCSLHNTACCANHSAMCLNYKQLITKIINNNKYQWFISTIYYNLYIVFIPTGCNRDENQGILSITVVTTAHGSPAHSEISLVYNPIPGNCILNIKNLLIGCISRRICAFRVDRQITCCWTLKTLFTQCLPNNTIIKLK